MARLRMGTSGATVAAGAPLWVLRFDRRGWADDGDLTHPLCVDFGVVLMREVLTHGRWSRARREWCDAHGVRVRDLPRPVVG